MQAEPNQSCRSALTVCWITAVLYKFYHFFVFIHNAWKEKEGVWFYFEKTVVPGKTGCKASRRACDKTIQGLVPRMKQHHEGYVGAPNTGDTTNTSDSEISLPSPRKQATPPTPILAKKKSCNLDDFVMQTSVMDKLIINLQK